MTSICAIVGCGKPVKTKNYCVSHYKRLWRHGDPLGGGAKRSKNTGLCSVDGCNNPTTRMSMCNAHYLRQHRYGRFHLIHPQKRPGGNHCHGECPGTKKLAAQLDYQRNAEKFKKRSAQWIIDNQDRYRQRIRDYLSREDVQNRARKRTREWVKENPDKKRAMDKAFAESNPALVRSYKAARRARVLRATPPWLTEEQLAEIRSVYAEAEKLTQETGIEHQVDHIVPLQGKTVCGLHVPWNLRAIPAVENNQRPRVWTG